MSLSTLFRFKGGIKPEAHKDASAGIPIAPAPLPSRLVIPLRQNARATARPLVEAGQRVLKGQIIGAAEGTLATAVHAPTSGLVRAVEMAPVPHPSGLEALCVIIEPDGDERWIDLQPFDHRNASPQRIRDYLRDCGIVGLGGANFPSHIKLTPGEAGIRTLILNGGECEPWITCDDRLMRERAERILGGALIMREITGASHILVGIEDNKPEAVQAMSAAASRLGAEGVTVHAVPALYPAGGEKQLIRVLTGVEIPYGKLGTHFGVQCFNVGTAYAIHRAITCGEPLLSRILTLTGNMARPGNFEVLIGTPIRELLPLADPRPDTDHFLMGGPMMGFALPSLSAPVVKATNCIIAASPALFPPPPPEMPCIRCGACAQVCPAELQPFELYWHARAKNLGKAQEYHVFDCIECGCCAYVCPSRIRLVDYFRYAKGEIWAREREKSAADAARERFEFRNLRTEREKQEKAERLAAKTAAGREAVARAAAAAPATASAPTAATVATASAPQPRAADATKALIQAALDRAKAQKAAVTPRNTDNLTAEQKAEIAEIEARRAKIREMARPHTPPDE
ncbi:MAG: electron transport complex subunit RsxC [Betaproteobacteria bacterium]|nr:electron transport complex subunit RsxC [Betaproteobacteria bacterium]